ncbi:MAG: hypothetical protein SGARI_003086 [Bacillariaceae sp.]
MESIVSQKDGEIAALTASLKEAQGAVESREAMAEELSAAQEESTKDKADAKLRNELERTKAALSEREAELQHAKRPSSPGSISTGVKVSSDTLSQDEPPPPKAEPVSAKLEAGGGDDDDGWGDDW